VRRVECLSADIVVEQIRAVLEDIPPAAIKTGALGNAEIVRAIAALTFACPLVVDPVMISKHGAPLVENEARDAIASRLLPRATLLTPNLHEAAALTGEPVDDVAGMRRAAARLCEMGCKAALVKGGHLSGSAVDILYHEGSWHEFEAPRIVTPHTHGTGCTYSAAITAGLASGWNLVDAIGRAKRYITRAIETNPGLGAGSGPVNHHAEVDLR
jgi:hydroxymethylpyrimidine/phosphomethylpyrimidine kinase